VLCPNSMKNQEGKWWSSLKGVDSHCGRRERMLQFYLWEKRMMRRLTVMMAIWRKHR
jgi:hypothetical protein